MASHTSLTVSLERSNVESVTATVGDSRCGVDRASAHGRELGAGGKGLRHEPLAKSFRWKTLRALPVVHGRPSAPAESGQPLPAPFPSGSRLRAGFQRLCTCHVSDDVTSTRCCRRLSNRGVRGGKGSVLLFCEDPPSLGPPSCSLSRGCPWKTDCGCQTWSRRRTSWET